MSETRYTSVLSAFGIERIVGYVVNVVNYSAEIHVENYYRSANVGYSATFSPGTPITRRMANPAVTSNPVDIRIRYGDPSYNIGIDGGFDVNRLTTTLFSTTKEALNIDEDYEGYEGDLDLLGKKIIVYRHVITSARGAVPSAVVVGVKTDVTEAANTASFETATATVEVGGYAATKRSVDFVTELVLGTPDDNKVETFNQRTTGNAGNSSIAIFNNTITGESYTAADRIFDSKRNRDAVRDLSLRFNLYSFHADGSLLNAFNDNDILIEESAWIDDDGLPADKDGNTRFKLGNNVEKELAKILKGNDGADTKNYRLTYVDNGLDSLGNTEFYYIFTPLQIGYAHDDTSGTKVKFEMGKQQIEPENKTGEPKNFELRAADDEEDAITPVKGEAYLFTAFGSEYKDITVYSKLDRLGKEVTLLSRAAGILRFNEAAYPRVEFSFAVNASKATGAWQASDIADKGDDSFRVLRGKYDIFGDADGIALIAKKVGDPPADNRNFHTRFGVVRTTGTPSAILLADGTVAYMHRVFDVTDKIENNYMLVPATTENDAAIFSAANGNNTGLAGAYIGLYNRTGSAYDAAVLVNPRLDDNGGTLTDNRSRILGAGSTPDRYSVLLKREDTATNTGLIGNNITSAVNTSIIRPDVPNRVNLNSTNLNSTTLDSISGTRATLGVANAASYTSMPLLGTAAAGVSREAIFNSNTRFVVIGAGNSGVARIADNLAQAGAIIGDNAIHSIAFVANGPGHVPGAASVVFIRSMEELTDPAIVPRVGVIVDSDSNFFFADANQVGAWAFDYASGTVVRVVTRNLPIGSLVRILNTEVEDIDGGKAFRTADLSTKSTEFNKTPTTLLSNTGRYSGGDRLTAIREALTFKGATGYILESVDGDGNHGTITVTGKVQYYRAGESMTIQAAKRESDGSPASPTAFDYHTIELSEGTYKMLFVDGPRVDGDLTEAAAANATDPSKWTGDGYTSWTKEGRTALSSSGVTGGLGSMNNAQYAAGTAVYAVVTYDKLTSEALAVTFIIYGVTEGDKGGDVGHFATRN